MEAIHRITSDDMEFMENFWQNIIHVIGSYGTAKESGEYEEKIKEKQEEMVALIEENAKTGSYTPEFDERYRTIAEEINALKEAQKTARNEKRMADSYEQRIQDIEHYLSTSTCQIPEFDNDFVRWLISTIKVESSEKLLIQFQSGIVMEQEIDEIARAVIRGEYGNGADCKNRITAEGYDYAAVQARVNALM